MAHVLMMDGLYIAYMHACDDHVRGSIHTCMHAFDTCVDFCLPFGVPVMNVDHDDACDCYSALCSCRYMYYGITSVMVMVVMTLQIITFRMKGRWCCHYC